mgnify:FL=1
MKDFRSYLEGYIHIEIKKNNSYTNLTSHIGTIVIVLYNLFQSGYTFFSECKRCVEN